MKQKANQHSALQTPLNNILGSKGHVMVLRELMETDHPMGHAELIDRTHLSRQGVYDVAHRLSETGIVMYVGSGNQQQLLFRKDHPLAESISELFEAEKTRFEELLNGLKKEISHLEIKPKSAWIFGKAAEGSDVYGDPVRIAVLGVVKTIDELSDQLRDQLYNADIENRYDVTIDIIGITVADIETRSEYISGPIILLWGSDPKFFLDKSASESESVKTHQDLDQQSLYDAGAWTELLKTHPEIIERTIRYLEKRIPEITSGEKKELKEWKQMLETMSFQRLKKFLVSDSERSVRLRQSLPFWPVLKEKERTKLEKLMMQKKPQDG